MTLTVSVVESISSISAQEWDAVACSCAPAPAMPAVTSSTTAPSSSSSATSGSGSEIFPYVQHAFLAALEASGSAQRDSGWGPRHVVVRDGTGQLVGCCPLYVKSHSYGEYVFDQSWANYSVQLGRPYYPKLQCCVPFTPCTGPRLMVKGGLPPGTRRAVLQSLGKALISIADASGVSSLHVTFNTAEEWEVLGDLGFLQRTGIQFHWENPGYSNFEDFLSTLKQSKRKSIRQERKSMEKQGLRIARLPGSELGAEQWDKFYSFYLSTVDKRWGTAYLTREFFHMIGETMPDQVLLAAAYDRNDNDALVAGALNLVGSHALFGRNWGCEREYRNLHFELCYYTALEEAIARGLPRVEAGAQGEHKLQRGYLPALTYSSHYIRDPYLRSAVSRFLQRERLEMDYTLQALTLQSSPYTQELTLQALRDKLQAYSGALSLDLTASWEDSSSGGSSSSSSSS